MLSDYSRIRPKSVSRLAIESLGVPTNSGLLVYMQQRKLLSSTRIISNYRKNINQKYTFPLSNTHIQFNPPISIRKTTIFKPSTTIGVGNPSPTIREVYSHKSKLRNLPSESIRSSLIKKIETLQKTRTIARVIKLPTYNDIKILGKKVSYNNAKRESISKSRDGILKMKYTIETPKGSVNINYSQEIPVIKKFNKILIENEDDTDSDRSILKLESKYNDAKPQTLNQMDCKTKLAKKKKKKGKKKHYKFRQSYRK
jgi:hypothetical protein